MPGELTAVLGHNGAGKSTLLKSIFGIVMMSRGSVSLNGRPVIPSPMSMVRAGVSFAPQGNRIFPQLTVLENLQLASVGDGKAVKFTSALDATLGAYSELGSSLERRAGLLSGGIRQILVLAMATIVAPRVLLLDEPCLGLAPALVPRILDRIRQTCRDHQIAALVVEQRVRQALEFADRVCVLRQGIASYHGEARSLRDPDALRRVFL
jgi:branched-chain amino acid transport system ATP-binding protein